MTLKEQVVRAWCRITGTPSRYKLLPLDQYNCMLNVKNTSVDGEQRFRAKNSYRYDDMLVSLLRVIGTRTESLRSIDEACSQLPEYITREEGNVIENENGSFARYRVRISGIPAILLLSQSSERKWILDENGMTGRSYTDELSKQVPPTSIYCHINLEGELFSQLPIPRKKVEEFIENLTYQLALTHPRDHLCNEGSYEHRGMSTPERLTYRKDLNASFAKNALRLE